MNGIKNVFRIGILTMMAPILTGCGAVWSGQESAVGESQAVLPSGEKPGNIIPVESIVEESQAVLPFEENPGNTTLLESAVRENPHEDSKYELLDEEGVQAYLKSLGMEDVSPVCFYSPEGAPKLELYYDRETGQGCGLEYEETEDED